MPYWPSIFSFIFRQTSLIPSQTLRSLQSSLSQLNFWIKPSRVSKMPATSIRDLETWSQLQNSVYMDFLSFSQHRSMLPDSNCVFVMYLSIGSKFQYLENHNFPLGRHSSEQVLGFAIFSYFLKSVGVPSIRPVKMRTILDFLSSSFRIVMYFRNSTIMYLYLVRVSGSLAQQLLTSHPSGSKQGRRMCGQIFCKMVLSFLKSLNFLWIMWLHGVNWIWQRVKSPCKKFLVFCSVFKILTSLIAGNGIKFLLAKTFISTFPHSIIFVGGTASRICQGFSSWNYLPEFFCYSTGSSSFFFLFYSITTENIDWSSMLGPEVASGITRMGYSCFLEKPEAGLMLDVLWMDVNCRVAVLISFLGGPNPKISQSTSLNSSCFWGDSGMGVGVWDGIVSSTYSSSTICYSFSLSSCC